MAPPSTTPPSIPSPSFEPPPQLRTTKPHVRLYLRRIPLPVTNQRPSRKHRLITQRHARIPRFDAYGEIHPMIWVQRGRAGRSCFGEVEDEGGLGLGAGVAVGALAAGVDV